MKRGPYNVASPKRDAVAQLLSEEFDFAQIAQELGITIKAVRRHFEMIRKALGEQAQ